jgi:hypothetical protein
VARAGIIITPTAERLSALTSSLVAVGRKMVLSVQLFEPGFQNPGEGAWCVR